MMKIWLYSEVICFAISIVVISTMYLYLKHKYNKSGGNANGSRL